MNTKGGAMKSHNDDVFEGISLDDTATVVGGGDAEIARACTFNIPNVPAGSHDPYTIGRQDGYLTSLGQARRGGEGGLGYSDRERQAQYDTGHDQGRTRGAADLARCVGAQLGGMNIPN
jgi:hypothetical protein